MGKISEILESGRFPSVVQFRIPIAGTSWKSGKATKRQMDASRQKPGYLIRGASIATSQGRDEKAPGADLIK